MLQFKWRDVLFLLSFLIAGCGDGKLEPQANMASLSVDMNAPGFKAFQTGFYNFANTQGCVNCHGTTVSPQFALTDVAQAYLNAKSRFNSQALIDFTNPTSSPFIIYAGNNHCSDTPCSNPANGQVVQGLLQTWASAELAAPVVGGGMSTPPLGMAMPTIFTQTLTFPTAIPSITSANTGVIRFPLSKLSPAVASVAIAIFEVEVQMINATEYRIRNPKIVGNLAIVNITGIHVFTRPATGTGIGVEDFAQGIAWVPTMVSAAIVALPNPIPTTPFKATSLEPLSLSIMVQSPMDSMTIGFESIK